MAQSKYFPDLQNGVNDANVEQIEKAFSDVETDMNNKADKATTLAGYGIADAYTKAEVSDEIKNKANKIYISAGNPPTIDTTGIYRTGDCWYCVTTDTFYACASVNFDEMLSEYYPSWIEIKAIVDNLTTDNTKRPLSANQGKVLDEKKADKTELQTLKRLSIPHTTASGYPLSITDSLAGEPLTGCNMWGNNGGVGDLSGDDNKYHVSVKLCGKNVLTPDYASVSGTRNGVEISVANGAVSFNGTATADTYFIFKKQDTFTIPKGKYTLSGGTSDMWLYVEAYNGATKLWQKSDRGSGITFDLTNETYTGIRLFTMVSSGKTVDITLKPQLEFGSIATDYEPYSTTVAAAILDTPLTSGEYIDLIRKKRVSGSAETDITVEGELKTIDGDVNNIICDTTVAPSKIDIEYYQDINKVLAELKNAIPHTTASGYPLTVTDHLEGESVINYQVYGNSVQDGTPTPETPIEIQSVGDLVTDETSEYYGKYDISVSINDETKHIYLNEPLRKVGDYADYIDFENQKVVRNVNYKAFTGKDGWLLEKQSEDFLRCYTIFDKKQIGFTNILSNTFNVGASLDDINTIYGRSNNRAVSICLSTEYATTLEEFKAFITERYNTGAPIICYYQLDTPTEEPITVPELTTPNSDVMNVSSGTAIHPSQIDLTYYQDINKVITNLTNAVLAQGGNT